MQKLLTSLVQEKPGPWCSGTSVSISWTSVRDEGLVVSGSLSHAWSIPVPLECDADLSGTVKSNQSCHGTSTTGQTKQRHLLLSHVTQAGCAFTRQTEGVTSVDTKRTHPMACEWWDIPKAAQGVFPICHIHIIPNKKTRTAYETYISACAWIISFK